MLNQPLIWVVALIAGAMAIKNPILPGFNPDPSILRVGDTYYIATSSFTIYPGIPIYKSKDLANWELISHALNRPETVNLYGIQTSNGVWAPSLSYIDDLFYVTSMTMLGSSLDFRSWPRIWWVSSPDLIHWSDVVWGEPQGIDPQLFLDPISKKTYLNLMSVNNNFDRLWGIKQCEVSLRSGKCIAPFRSIWNGTLPQTNKTRPEGPKEFYKDGFYYLVLAEGGTGTTHRVSIGRSKSPEGPWEGAPNNPLIYHGDQTNLTISSTGHATFTDTPNGTWYASFLARRNVKSWSALGRETFLVAVEWNSDGWPTMNGGQKLMLSQSIPGGPDQQLPRAPFVDKFEGPQLDLGWHQLRTPYTVDYRLKTQADIKPGPGLPHSASNSTTGVILIPNVFTLSDRDTPAALIRKTTSLNMTFSATLLPTNAGFNPRQSVGISAYISELNHQDIGVRGCTNTTGLCLYTEFKRNSLLPQDPTILTEYHMNYTAIPADLTLHIRIEPLTSKLGYSYGGNQPTWVAEFSSQLLASAPSGYSVFDGSMLSLFASGNGEPWPFDAPDVGFSQVREVYYEENLPDINAWP